MTTGRELEVILTHEHTDFDALASLLAAALLFPGATPVLPRQMNRNVREFVTLFRSHLPFVSADELPRGARIRRSIVVDTRAMNAPRALLDNAEVLIIDHHAALGDERKSGRSLPATWQVWSEAVGANTTLLVEKLSEQQLPLTPVHATLLALGIHEDTGSLTYGGATHRDARALAWLLEPERSVNMNLVNHFLQHPLSEQQRQLLEDLIAHSEFVEIEGHNIVIAQAQAAGFGEEISTVAARLRDYHEPDAVFLLIELGDMVQFVARSMTDEVDVGAVARALGGGGHARAAAAPIHDANVAELHDRVLDLVRSHARSAVTVRQIMSIGRPQILSPEMSIDEAGELMRRYGHEGFPVVREGDNGEELLGVLTRREADRAINHGLGGEPVRRFMRAGQITVQPNDSIPLLRRRMIDSGWGQIPVVDEQGHIVGIVTRTDLIKLWDDAALPERRVDEIEQRLRAFLTPAQLHILRLVGEEVDSMHYTVYVVGGFVRDLLLNTPSERTRALDVDIVIEGDAIDFAQRMKKLYGGRIVPHRQFGTAKWLLNDADHPLRLDRLLARLAPSEPPMDEADHPAKSLPAHLDFVTARTEFYTAPTVLPTVESSSIKLDLHRRDFTINTLALCLNPDRWGQLLDFYGGVNDLREGIVRVLHSLSFVDDPTRILRAVRYEQRFGFRIDPRTLELIGDALEMLDRVTPARIRHEFERILQEEQPEHILARLGKLGVLAAIHPALQADEWVIATFPRLRAALQASDCDPALKEEPIARLYWALFVYPLPDAADAELQTRLGLRKETQRTVQDIHWLRAHLALLREPELRPSQAVAVLEKVESVGLALFSLLCEDSAISAVLTTYQAKWRHIHAELDGNDLARLGIPRGPIYRAILANLRAARLDGVAHNREDEVEMALSLIAQHKNEGSA
jgi:tRNA nucleotidyltransferase (CCA-adding enzyme)